MFRAVRQLPAGHLLVADESGVEIRRWWRLRYGPKNGVGLQEAADDVEGLMGQAVRRRLISDVPLGCFLSGGLDSSAVLSFMAEASAEPVRTFSIGFDEGWASDELPAARSTAAAFGARHHETRIGPDEFLDLLPSAVWHRDEPLAEPSEIPLLALSRMAREHVTVVLSGEGGDELFGGYPKYRADRVLALAGTAGRAVLGARRLRRIAAWERLPRRARLAVRALASEDPGERWPAWFGADREAGLWPPGLRPLASIVEGLPPGLGPLDAMLALDVESYLVDNLLVRGDKMTMAASIEGRMPLLDHDLAEFAARLPESLKARPRRTKVVVREVARRRLPESLLHRKKIGFAVPIASWFRGGLGDALERMALGAARREEPLVPPETTRLALGLHRAGRYDLGKELWSLLTLEIWARIFLDGGDPEQLAAAAPWLSGCWCWPGTTSRPRRSSPPRRAARSPGSSGSSARCAVWRGWCPSTPALRALADGRPLPARAAALTFDDGYRDNLELLVPALQRLGLPATVYLVPGLIERSARPWWETLAWAFRNAREPALERDGAPLPAGDRPGARRPCSGSARS